MANRSGRDLDHGRAAVARRLGICLGLQIAHYHRAADPGLQPPQGRSTFKDFHDAMNKFNHSLAFATISARP
jgi:hypothetical protein